MKVLVAILGILCTAGGTCCGFANWFLTEFYLMEVDWQGPLVTVNQITWFCNIAGMGLGVLLIGIAAAMSAARPPTHT